MRRILVKAVRNPVPVIERLPTRYQRQFRDRQRVQLWLGLVFVTVPVALIVWEVTG